MATSSLRARARGWQLLAVVGVVAAAIPIGIAGATHDANTIHACVRSMDGAVRIVASGTECRNGETSTQWNQTGPPGPAGPAGPAGPPGPAGGGTAGGDSEISYLTCTGDQQGVIEGGSVEESHQGWIEVLSYSHGVTSPVDTSSGLPTGKRQHKPFVVVKPVDKASPRLLQALVTNEAISTCKFEIVAASDDGLMTRFRVDLGGVRVIGVEQQTTQSEPPMETVSFVFHNIVWTWTDGPITASDSWTTQS